MSDTTLFDQVESSESGRHANIKCLSLWEPWASLMACGAKRNETRSWPTSYRGPLLICASKKRIPELPSILTEPAFKRGLSALWSHGDNVGVLIGRLGFGMAVAVVDLVDCVATDLIAMIDDDERQFGDYSRGRFAWVTTNLRRIRPFPITGRQGLWSETVQTDRLRAAP